MAVKRLLLTKNSSITEIYLRDIFPLPLCAHVWLESGEEKTVKLDELRPQKNESHKLHPRFDWLHSSVTQRPVRVRPHRVDRNPKKGPD